MNDGNDGGLVRAVVYVSAIGAGFGALAISACFSSSGGSSPDSGTTTADGPETQGATDGAPRADATIGDGGAANDASRDSVADGGLSDGGAQTRVPVALFPSPGTYGVTGISVDSEYVYWAADIAPGTINGSAIFRVSKGGGTPAIVYSPPAAAQCGSTAVDGTFVYFGVSNYPPGNCSVIKAPKDGSGADASTPQVLGTFNGGGLVDLAMDSVNVYVAFKNGVWSIPLDGGSENTVVDPNGASPVDPVVGLAIGHPGIWGLTTDGTNVYYTASQTSGAGLPVTSPLAYAGWVLAAPVGGSTTQTIIAPDQHDAGGGGGYASGLSGRPNVYGGSVYWASSGYVYKGSTSSSMPTILASAPGGGSGVCMTDGTNIYGFFNGGDLMKVPIAGGTPVTWVAANVIPFAPAVMAMDDTSLYLSGGSIIYKVAK